MQRIKRQATYYTDRSRSNHWCLDCYDLLKPEEPIVLDDGSDVAKADLQELKNDAVPEEGWVNCDECKSWVHQICALFNGRTNKSTATYTCPNCYLAKLESGSVPLSKTVKKAVHLPESKLSREIEKGLGEALKLAYNSRAKELDVGVEEVEKAEGLTVRVISNVEKKHIVGDEVRSYFCLECICGFLPSSVAHSCVCSQMLRHYEAQNCPTYFPVRTKCIALFQSIHGVDTLLFALYVYEYGHDCPAPNKRRVYISYLDSVQYFEPKCYRTAAYHAVLIEYLRYVKKRGFHTAHIWSCPPTPGDDYIFYCHPDHQKIPREDMLRAWYHKMLDSAKSQGVVIRTTTLYDEYFKTDSSESVPEQRFDATCLPYFEGDYIPGEIENIIKQHRSQAVFRDNATSSSKNAAAQDDVMKRIGQNLRKMKDNFILVHLRNRRFAAAVERGQDVSHWMEDSDEELVRSKRAKISAKAPVPGEGATSTSTVKVSAEMEPPEVLSSRGEKSIASTNAATEKPKHIPDATAGGAIVEDGLSPDPENVSSHSHKTETETVSSDNDARTIPQESISSTERGPSVEKAPAPSSDTAGNQEATEDLGAGLEAERSNEALVEESKVVDDKLGATDVKSKEEAGKEHNLESGSRPAGEEVDPNDEVPVKSDELRMSQVNLDEPKPDRFDQSLTKQTDDGDSESKTSPLQQTDNDDGPAPRPEADKSSESSQPTGVEESNADNTAVSKSDSERSDCNPPFEDKKTFVPVNTLDAEQPNAASDAKTEGVISEKPLQRSGEGDTESDNITQVDQECGEPPKPGDGVLPQADDSPVALTMDTRENSRTTVDSDIKQKTGEFDGVEKELTVQPGESKVDSSVQNADTDRSAVNPVTVQSGSTEGEPDQEKSLADDNTAPSNKRGFEEIGSTISSHVNVLDRPEALVGDTTDEDEPFESEMFESRQLFLNYCQTAHCQFDELRRAKHSSMMVLFQLHNPSAPKFLQQCGSCYVDITHGIRYHCNNCPDFDLCEDCYEPVTTGLWAKRDARFAHDKSHNFTSIDMEATMESRASREQRQKALRTHIALLEHAGMCSGPPSCSLKNCERIKGLFMHVRSCATKPKKDCRICSRLLSLCAMHARNCPVRDGACPIPFCDRIRERYMRLRRQQQHMDDRRRQAQNELYHASES